MIGSQDGNGDILGRDQYPVPVPTLDLSDFPRSPSPIPVSGLPFSHPRPRLELWGPNGCGTPDCRSRSELRQGRPAGHRGLRLRGLSAGGRFEWRSRARINRMGVSASGGTGGPRAKEEGGLPAWASVSCGDVGSWTTEQ